MDEYMGYRIQFLHISWNCPALKLYGYSTERALQSAIRKEVTKRANKQG